MILGKSLCGSRMFFSVRLTYVCCDMVKEVTAYVGHLGIVMMADDGGGVNDIDDDDGGR